MYPISYCINVSPANHADDVDAYLAFGKNVDGLEYILIVLWQRGRLYDQYFLMKFFKDIFELYQAASKCILHREMAWVRWNFQFIQLFEDKLLIIGKAAFEFTHLILYYSECKFDDGCILLCLLDIVLEHGGNNT